MSVEAISNMARMILVEITGRGFLDIDANEFHARAHIYNNNTILISLYHHDAQCLPNPGRRQDLQDG